jgi:hypothetical protein
MIQLSSSKQDIEANLRRKRAAVLVAVVKIVVSLELIFWCS